jgi:hypothetical protein
VAAVQRVIALRWWRQALPVAPGRAPTLARPAMAHDLGDGETLEVHRDGTSSGRAILVRRKGAGEEVRLLL